MSFIAAPGGLEVVIEADKRAGLFSDGHDTVHRFTVSHHAVPHTDWNAQVDAWLKEVIAGHVTRAVPSSGAEHHGDRRGSGPGGGAVVAGVAAGVAVGVVGGMVAAEVVDEIGDAFEEEEGDEGAEGDEG